VTAIFLPVPKVVLNMQQWNEAFKKNGRIFTEIQEDIPKITAFFKDHNVKRILDLGFGSGRHTVYLAREGFDVYGLDVAMEGLRLTKSWLKQENVKAHLKIGNIYEGLPYPDNFFGAIVSSQVIHHSRIESIRELIKEMERVLVSHGLVFITVPERLARASETVAPRTYVPLEGMDKGLVHYIFKKSLLRKEFSNFRINRIWVDSHQQYCLLGELKK
jgi:SAM-dependent methyltransferase